MTISSPTGSTRVVGVIGDPVRHSLSPVLHNAAFVALGMDWTYVAFHVATGLGAQAVEAVRALGIEGLSVTMPHKSDVAAAVDVLSDDAAALGAVNTVLRRNSQLVGDSTDGYGFMAALAEAGFDPAGKRCMVVGAGGAGRAVVLALARGGAARIVVVNRHPGRAAAAVALGGGVAVVGGIESATESDLVVNATPVGMGLDHNGAVGASVVDADRLGPGQFVNDLVYHPAQTPLLLAGAQRGATVLNGLPMLVHQAARQFELWTGEVAPLAAMRGAVDHELSSRAG